MQSRANYTQDRQLSAKERTNGLAGFCVLPTVLSCRDTRSPRQCLLMLIVSEFQHQAYSMLPGFTRQQTRGRPGLTVAKADRTTEDKGMGSIWPGITAFKKGKNGTVKRICMTAPRTEQHGNGTPANVTLIWC
ncbi:hypothetical protein F2P81_020293 [Scophthalmus maximus]|uniref:Uncharacterized protein n=1 Tax=Scophthalmus maximus TaxID=52904 RepID=A0A6A4S8V8_SCOMX|nr:hypothetical protein F2P81_020293 [Scophthalmus maximus]